MPDQKRLLIIDSFALIHRAYHAFPDTLTTAKGEPVNAVYGFTSLIIDVLTKFAPGYIIFVFDAPGENFRKDLYEGYKAHRSAPDELMIQQIPKIREFVSVLDVPRLEVVGVEADDVIGTLVRNFETSDQKETIIVTGDRDLLQLVDDNTKVYLAGSSFSKSQLYDANGVVEKMGLRPDQIIDLKSLEGDTSDNIPGVMGIGKTGAVSLLKEFETLDNLLANLDKVPNRYKTKLENGIESARLSQKLATIKCDVELEFNFSDAKLTSLDQSQMRDFLVAHEFRSLIGRLDKLQKLYVDNSEQVMSLFSEAEMDAPVVELAPYTHLATEDLDELFLYSVVDGDDAIGKSISSLIYKCRSGCYKVNNEDLEKFIAELSKAGRVVTNDAKSLMQITAAETVKYFDLPIAAAISSSGSAKPDFTVIIENATGQKIENLGEAKLLSAMELYYREVQEILSQNGPLQRIVDLEHAVMPVVANMEVAGIKLDNEHVQALQIELTKELTELEQTIYQTVGHEFNIASPKQVGEILFVERGLPGGKKTKSGGYSTDERTLRDFAKIDPLIEQILKFRELSKLLNTYIKPLPLYINQQTKRVHGNFNQIGAVTGRFSSDKPNLQNIPIRDESGKLIRKSFVADEGNMLVSVDYSQQELRLLAQLSGEKILLDAFNNNVDVHSATAALLFDIPLEQVSSDHRRIGKTINFGIIYGMGTFGLADRLKIDNKKAAEFIRRYFERYPAVKEYYDKLIEDAKQQGFVSTIMGRRRTTEGLNSNIYPVREAAKREIMNFPMQGSAADFMKVAMVGIAKEIKEFPARIVLQIHDEVLIEYGCEGKTVAELTQDKTFNKFANTMYDVMESVADLDVKLDADMKIGKNWLEMTKIEKPSVS